jgi:hypothetical protein
VIAGGEFWVIVDKARQAGTATLASVEFLLEKNRRANKRPDHRNPEMVEHSIEELVRLVDELGFVPFDRVGGELSAPRFARAR